ncbi:hypothetical protein CDL12_23204 [Handroanthus impetiginosus]|uniref:Disease resistance N-terminal domain-containing protein n=1 Tax=Handroanthus impetiginosus TaxID=429701 RepID=A0A2G9GGX0_9LAMI|nr:hypothetical protein CDL12_23204 [Handroanthus impetiginosus]
MADAAVEFLLENIKQLLLDQDRLIKDAKSQLQILEKDLSMFKALLEEHSTEKRNKNKALKELMRQIREVVYDAEDIIDAYVTQAAQNKTRNFLTRIVLGRAKLLSLSQNIEGIGQEVKRIYEKSRADFSTLHLGSLSGSDTGMEHKESKQIKRKDVHLILFSAS